MSSDDKFVHEDTNFWQVFMQEKSYLIFFPRAVKWMIITGDLLRQLKRKTFREKKGRRIFYGQEDTNLRTTELNGSNFTCG